LIPTWLFYTAQLAAREGVSTSKWRQKNDLNVPPFGEGNRVRALKRGQMGDEMALRVKMIDGREIEVAVPRDGKIAHIAERVLDAEDAPLHKMIRLIYGGRLLQPEDLISAYNIGPQVVIHAVISDVPVHIPSNDTQPAHAPPGAAEPSGRRNPTPQWAANSGGMPDEETLEGALLKVPPGIMLVLLWYVFVTRGGSLFSWFSTLSLVALTFLYLCYTLPRSFNGPALLERLLHVWAHPPPPRQTHSHQD